MNLDELNGLANEATKLDREAERTKESEESFAKLRTEGKPLWIEMTQSGVLRYREHDHSFLQGVINEFGNEILRLAELRKHERARSLRIKASMIRKQIEAALGPQGVSA